MSLNSEREEKEAIIDQDGNACETPEEIELDERENVREQDKVETVVESDTDNDSDSSGENISSSENIDDVDGACLPDKSTRHCDENVSLSGSKRKYMKKLRSKLSCPEEKSDDNDFLDNDSQSDHEPELLQSTDSDSDDGPNTHEPKTLESLGILLNKSECIWKSHKGLQSRELGVSVPYLFTRNVTGSLNMVQKFKLERKLEYHAGCVNTLNFNERGDLLASGSDDLNVVLWDWARGMKKFHYESGHTGNVFQVCISIMLHAPIILRCDISIYLAVIYVVSVSYW